MSKLENLVDNGQLRKHKTEKKPPRVVLRGVDKVDTGAGGRQRFIIMVGTRKACAGVCVNGGGVILARAK